MTKKRKTIPLDKQASFAFNHVLNLMREDRRRIGIAKVQSDCRQAMELMNECIDRLKHLLYPATGGMRGSWKGVHGFCAENLEVYSRNARNISHGKKPVYELLDNNSPVDYVADGIDYQLKASQKNFGIDAIKGHMEKYPQYQGKIKYAVCKDFAEKIDEFRNLTEQEVQKLGKKDRKLANKVRDFFKEYPDVEVEGTLHTYAEVQANAALDTAENEKALICRVEKNRTYAVMEHTKPTWTECLQAAAVASMIGAAAGAITGIYDKHKEGIQFREYSVKDVKDIAKSSAKNAATAGVEGAVAYGLINKTPLSAPGAYAAASAAVGIGTETIRFTSGKISEREWGENIIDQVSLSAFAYAGGRFGKRFLSPALKLFLKNDSACTALGTLIGMAGGSLVWAFGGRKVLEKILNKETETGYFTETMLEPA